LGLALILGGAAGNLIDRVTAGFVLDFVDFHWADYHFWAFNLADSAITVGVVGMLLDMIRTESWRRQPARGDQIAEVRGQIEVPAKVFPTSEGHRVHRRGRERRDRSTLTGASSPVLALATSG
jgi:hypothetical protein